MSMHTQYKMILNHWPKEAGPKPKMHHLQEASSIKSCRLGSKDTFAVAMALRPFGATQRQIIAALGNKHRNKIMALIKKRRVKRVKIPSDKFLIYKIKLN